MKPQDVLIYFCVSFLTFAIPAVIWWYWINYANGPAWIMRPAGFVTWLFLSCAAGFLVMVYRISRRQIRAR